MPAFGGTGIHREIERVAREGARESRGGVTITRRTSTPTTPRKSLIGHLIDEALTTPTGVPTGTDPGALRNLPGGIGTVVRIGTALSNYARERGISTGNPNMPGVESRSGYQPRSRDVVAVQPGDTQPDSGSPTDSSTPAPGTPILPDDDIRSPGGFRSLLGGSFAGFGQLASGGINRGTYTRSRVSNMTGRRVLGA